MSTNSATLFSLVILTCGWLVIDRPMVAQAVTSPMVLKSGDHISPIKLTNYSDRQPDSSDAEREGLPRRRADGGSR